MAEHKGHIVLIDDEQSRSPIENFLKAEGYQVTHYSQPSDALAAFWSSGSLHTEASDADIVVTDLKTAHRDGTQFLQAIHKEHPEVPVILITELENMDTAFEAMKNGAYDYIVKPFKLVEIRVIVERALEKRTLSRHNIILRQAVKQTWEQGGIVGKSVAMKRVLDLVQRVSHSLSNVLITGESGTGKEVIARLIHSSGPRAAKPFLAINCTAIPETLLESEFFGHAKGSFTGAYQRKRGLFEEADGGTVFLDEIGDMSPSLQVKLLRVIQEKKIRAVGDNLSHDVDVRIIAATHKDLRVAIKEHFFREDLYYRLSVIPIVIPPLRNRPDDIPLLADHFLKKFSAASGAIVRGFTKRATGKLMNMRWEGNVRELENVIERAVVLCQTHLIEDIDILDPDIINAEQFFRGATNDFPTLTQVEERYVRLVLEKTGGRKDKAANILGINRRTLYRKEKQYNCVQSPAPQAGPNPLKQEEFPTPVKSA